MGLEAFRYIHYSYSPFVFDAGCRYSQSDDMKPRGLWVSAENTSEDSFGWRDWCTSNDYHHTGLNYQTEIFLRPDANILHLPSCQHVDAFTRKYSRRHRVSFELDRFHQIDWPRVVREFQGIIIAPYQWERRMTQHTFWYYGWDCASGCLWDLSAVASTVILGVPIEQQSL